MVTIEPTQFSRSGLDFQVIQHPVSSAPGSDCRCLLIVNGCAYSGHPDEASALAEIDCLLDLRSARRRAFGTECA